LVVSSSYQIYLNERCARKEAQEVTPEMLTMHSHEGRCRIKKVRAPDHAGVCYRRNISTWHLLNPTRSRFRPITLDAHRIGDSTDES